MEETSLKNESLSGQHISKSFLQMFNTGILRKQVLFSSFFKNQQNQVIF
jgi:hypothetical protein